MTSKKKVAVLYHLFYEDTIEHLYQQLKPLDEFDTTFLFNINVAVPNRFELRQTLLEKFPTAFVSFSTNTGKDIGGKLLMIGVCLALDVKPDWILLLHDKKSLQALNANAWKTELFKILSPTGIEAINNTTSLPNTFGIVASEKYVVEELWKDGMFRGINGQILDKLVRSYDINPSSYKYVAGTMFWAKADVFLQFFKQHNPLLLRETLEGGNVIDNFKGTHTHSWERLLTWIITARGLNIKTI